MPFFAILDIHPSHEAPGGKPMDDNKPTDDSIQSTEGEVQEGEVVVSADLPAQDASSDTSAATVLESLESLIRENISKIDTLTSEASKQKEMIDSYLGNDETYRLHDEAAKKAAKTKSATKSEILKRPEISHVAKKVQELSVEIKEIKESMNSYLQEFQRLSGSNEIEVGDGEPMQIIYFAKLVKRRP